MAKIRHVCLIVKNLNKSLKFYVENFKFKVIRRDKLSGKYVETLFGVYGVELEYAKIKDKKGNEIELLESNVNLKPHIAFTVKNIDAVYNRLKDKMCFISPPFDAPDTAARVCHCLDNDFNEIELVQELKRKKKK